MRSCNHCCSGKAIIVTYCESVFVALVVQHVLRVRHIVNCGLPTAHNFSHFLINDTISERKLIEHILCVLNFSTTFFLKYSSF